MGVEEVLLAESFGALLEGSVGAEIGSGVGMAALGSEAAITGGAAAAAGDVLLGDTMTFGLTDAATTSAALGSVGAGIELGGFAGGAQLAGSGAAAAGGGLNWSDVKSALQIAGPAMSIGSGLYGMSQAEAMRKQALLSQNRSAPWQASGGMGLADQQLQQLLQNPGQVASQDPAYALRMQGAQRAASQYGQDSGAMSVAGANASTDWYNQRLQQLGGLAGAGVNPAGGQQVSLQGTEAANKLASSSLGSIGYGATSLGGNSMGFTPQQIAALQAAGIKLPPGMLS